MDRSWWLHGALFSPWCVHGASVVGPWSFGEESTGLFRWWTHGWSMVCPWWFTRVRVVGPWWVRGGSVANPLVGPGLQGWYVPYIKDPKQTVF